MQHGHINHPNIGLYIADHAAGAPACSAWIDNWGLLESQLGLAAVRLQHWALILGSVPVHVLQKVDCDFNRAYI